MIGNPYLVKTDEEFYFKVLSLVLAQGFQKISGS